jgi:hypothetical protein
MMLGGELDYTMVCSLAMQRYFRMLYCFTTFDEMIWGQQFVDVFRSSVMAAKGRDSSLK